MIRLPKIRIPEELKKDERLNEILGDTKGGMMYDCLYNQLLTEESVPLRSLREDLPKYLKDYQEEDLRKALCLDNVFNINKPGYGKTLETITWIKLTQASPFSVLVLCPKSAISTWEEQLKKFWPECYSAGTWWITNYEQLFNEERLNIAKSIEWDVVVLDESHRIKSMKSLTTQTVFQLKSKCRHCLTGTPIKNRPEDLAAQLKWLDPFSITNYTDFKFSFCYLQKTPWGDIPKGLTRNKTMVQNLQKLLDCYCVGGQEHYIGEAEHIKVRLKLDDEVKLLYRKIEGEWDPQLKKKVVATEELLKHGVKVSNAIEAATRRQQLTSNCQLYLPNSKNVKFEWINDWLDGTDEKVVIFSKYAKTIEALEKYLKQHKRSFTVMKKEYSAVKRKTVLEQWKRQTQALIGTYGVLKESIDGLQEHCHYAIFVDREWTASDNIQAEGRLYRTGQQSKVFFYILQAIGTIDIQIERVQLDKGHAAEELLTPVQNEESLD